MKVSDLTSSLLVRKGGAMPSTLVAPIADRLPPALRVQPPATETPPPRPDALPHSPVSGDTKRIRVSVRLDPGRHRALKLIAAHTGRSVQDLAVAALDEYLVALGADVRGGQCVCLNDEAAPDARTNEG